MKSLNKKYLVQLKEAYPHVGEILRKRIQEQGITQNSLALQLDINPNGIMQYMRNPSLQTGILWKAGVILRYNFFAELAEAFPVKVLPEAHRQEVAELQTQLAEKDQQIRDLEKELAIYKRIVLTEK